MNAVRRLFERKSEISFKRLTLTNKTKRINNQTNGNMVVVNDKFSEFKQNWYLQQLINTTNKKVIKNGVQHSDIKSKWRVE